MIRLLVGEVFSVDRVEEQMLDSVKSFVSGVSSVEGIDSVQRHKSNRRKDQEDQMDERENAKILVEKEGRNESRSTPVNVDFGVVFDLLNGILLC